jgi:ATP-binding cassette subfamily B protein
VRSIQASKAGVANSVDRPRYVSLRGLFAEPWMRQQLAPYRPYMVQILAIMFTTIAINFTLPLTNRTLVNQGILIGDAQFVWFIIGLQVAMYLALIALNAVRAKISGHISIRLVSRMSSSHVAELLSLPISYFSGSRSGEIVERIRDLDRVQRFAAVEALDALTASISIFSLGLLLALVDLSIFLVFAGSAAAYLGWIHLVGLRRRQTDAAQFVQASRARALEIAMIEGIVDIKVAGYEVATLDRWAGIQTESLRTRLQATAIEQLQATGGHFFTRVGMVAVTLISGLQTIRGTITLGDFTITAVIIVQLYFHLNQILGFSNKLEEVRAAMHRTREIRTIFGQEQAAAARSVTPGTYAPIVFDAVDFTYPTASAPTLRNIGFTIPAGKMTALIGPSGSGKTTVLRLLLGVFGPDSGRIEVTGTWLGGLNQRTWLDGVGAVMQDGALFAATILDNVLAGQPEDAGWLAVVTEAARLQDIVAHSPAGFATLVGAGGTHLSAGQQQRILLARALYKRPKLLLLDEATSALDGANESAIVENIQALLPQTTSVVAAHRLQTLRHASHVISLDGGMIVHVGDRVPDEAMLASLSRKV